MGENKQITNTRMARLALVLIVLLIGLFAILTYTQVNKKTMPKEPEQPVVTKIVSPAQVSITKNGFSPQTIQVKKGQSITWTNTDKNPHQVASGPHPTHTNLPGFDGQEALTTNDSFTFTFEKTGTFTYHDHLNPLKFQGTVVVTE